VDFIASDLLSVSDVVEFQRQYAPESCIIINKLKEKGIVCVFHVDDNVWDIPPNNPAVSTYAPGGPVVQRYEMVMRSAHAVTTSTPHLAKEIMKRCQNSVYINRNLVDPEIADFITPGRDNPEEVRIGWFGTPHHHDDIVPMEPIFPELTKLSKVKLVFMGYAPPTVLHNIPRKRWEYYDFVPVDGFYPALANLDFDIGLAPLVDNGFNKGKTARKAQEFAICKVPMILAPVLCYRDWRHGDTCLKPKENTPQAWYERIRFLIENPKERERLARNAFVYVNQNHNIHTFIWERAASYYKIYKEAKGVEHPYSDYIREGLRQRGLTVDF